MSSDQREAAVALLGAGLNPELASAVRLRCLALANHLDPAMVLAAAYDAPRGSFCDRLRALSVVDLSPDAVLLRHELLIALDDAE